MRKGNLWALLLALVMLMTTPGAYAEESFSMAGYDDEATGHVWTENRFFERMEALGVRTIICTDISRDGAMKGTNRALYKAQSERFSIDLIASGGVSSMEDIAALKEMGLHGAIIGKAYYTGAIDLKEALEAAR